MRVETIACLSDNYAYLVVCEKTKQAALVDASEAGPVSTAIERAEKTGVKLAAVWSTHHHFDHVGGNEEVVKRWPVDVAGHASDRGRIPAQTQFLEEGASFTLGALSVRTLHIPGHTTGAIAYIVDEQAVFTGDTLFLAGCGRIFEGTPEMMHASLQKLAALADATKVYCGHEYTAANLRFAAHVEPSNADVRAALVHAAEKPTVPGTIGHEKKTNPFLRATSPEIRKTLGVAPDADVVTAFARIREAKNAFKG